jgi:collagenase-like PrtC family protease
MDQERSEPRRGVVRVVVRTVMAVAMLVGTDVQVVAGAVMGVSTVRLARFVEAEGAARLITPHELLLPEVASIIQACRLEVEVPIQTGFGIDPARSRLSDLPGIGLGCRAGWACDDGSEDPPSGPGMLDGAGDCGLCDVPRLMGLGVAALQLPGRESPNLRQNAKVTQMYRRVLEGTRIGKPVSSIVAEIDRVELSWQMGWVPRLCEQQRCRFRETPQTKAYV